MAARFDNGAHQLQQEVTLSLGSVAASSFGVQTFSVAGVEADYCYDAYAPVAFSADFFLMGAKALSQHNIQLLFFNHTASAIAHASTAGIRIVSR